ncbi:MAG: hypothetical protein V4629_07420, partial [Pseudomonadota bacterium]
MKQSFLIHVKQLLNFKELSYQLLVLITGICFVLVYNYGALEFLNVESYVAGKSQTPYQYRTLMAWLAQPIVFLLNTLHIDSILSVRPPPFNNVTRVALMSLNLISIIVLINLVRFHLGQILKDPIFARLGSILILYVLPFNLINYPRSNYWVPYDLSGIAFFYGLFLLGLYNQWRLFFVIFPLAVLNRETVIFVCGILFLIHFKSYPLKKSMLILTVQVAIFVLLKTWLFYLFEDNPTDKGAKLYMNQIEPNLDYLKNPMWWPALFASFGFLWLPVVKYFKLIQVSSITTAIACFPLYLIIMLLVGQIVEVRIFSEYVPFFLVAALIIFHR